jgi:hypothetical protein
MIDINNSYPGMMVTLYDADGLHHLNGYDTTVVRVDHRKGLVYCWVPVYPGDQPFFGGRSVLWPVGLKPIELR